MGFSVIDIYDNFFQTFYAPGYPFLVCLWQKNFILDHKLTVPGNAFLVHMCTPCDNTYLSLPKLLTVPVPKFLNLWHWSWPFTYILKTFTLIITFEIHKRSGFHYIISVFQVWQDLSVSTNIFSSAFLKKKPQELLSWPWRCRRLRRRPFKVFC